MTPKELALYFGFVMLLWVAGKAFFLVVGGVMICLGG